MPISGGGKPITLGEIKKVAPFTLALTTGVIIPAGRMVIAFFTSHAQALSLSFQILDAGGWHQVERYEDGGALVCITDRWIFVPFGFLSDGTNIRIFNAFGGGPITDIEYMYQELE